MSPHRTQLSCSSSSSTFMIYLIRIDQALPVFQPAHVHPFVHPSVTPRRRRRKAIYIYFNHGPRCYRVCDHRCCFSCWSKPTSSLAGVRGDCGRHPRLFLPSTLPSLFYPQTLSPFHLHLLPAGGGKMVRGGGGRGGRGMASGEVMWACFGGRGK